MQQPGSILCVTLGGHSMRVAEQLLGRGWDLAQANDLAAERHAKNAVWLLHGDDPSHG